MVILIEKSDLNLSFKICDIDIQIKNIEYAKIDSAAPKAYAKIYILARITKNKDKKLSIRT